MNSRTLAGVLGAALVAGVASAQTTQAVEWAVSDGGNGHWYAGIWVGSPVTWRAARLLAEQRGGHLATPSSSSEDLFLRSTFLPGGLYRPDYVCCLGPYIGAFNDGEGWRWVDGTPWTFSNWCPGNPNENPFSVVVYFGPPDRLWQDQNDVLPEYMSYSYMIEWDADCNGDGMVDYGQILRGELIDLNGNGVPDICETSVSSVLPPSVPAQGGSTVTIRGNGFQANPTVLIGGVPASNVVRVSLTQITATSPALLPGMASVQVNGFTLQDAIYIRPECGSDLDQDGEVTAADIAIVLLDFGPCYSNAAAPEPDSSTPFMLREEAAPASPQAR